VPSADSFAATFRSMIAEALGGALDPEKVADMSDGIGE
jgi:hypothetical protein